MTTNFKKLVGWNLEEYNDMSDDGCLVCLTEKERYLLGQMTRQITWLTRWDNPESGMLPNLYEIQGKLDYKMSLQGCIDLCQQILDCIENTEGIQEAIAFYGGGSNINADSEENATNLAGQLVNDPMGCDDDIIFGMTVQLVEFADRLIKDLFEKLSAAQLSSVNVGYLIKLVPVLETLPIDEAFELADKLVEDMETAYLSASTQLLKDEIACDLFCLAKDNDCVLTLEMVRDYYQEKAEITFSYDSVFYFMSDFIDGSFIGNAVYYGMNIFFFQIFVFGGKFLEYFFEDYLRTIQAMYNDPNSDWSTLCDECVPEWEFIFDFREDDYDTYVSQIDGSYPAVWTDGEGYVGGHDSLGARGGIVVTMPGALDLTFIESSTNQNITAANTRAIGWRAYDESPPVAPAVDEVIFAGDTDGIVNLEKTGEFDAIESIEVYCGSRQGASSYSKIEQLILRGTGDNPFI